MKSRVPLNTLRAFEAVGRHSHVHRAADELHLTHTALSSKERRAPPVAPTNGISPDLMDSYLAAEYIVHTQGEELVLKIGEPSPATLGSQPWSLITAHNPYSRPLRATDNQALQQSLTDMLAVYNYRTLPATGRSTDGQWQEASLLVLNISRDLARTLGSRFRQNAVVFAEAGGPVELLPCDKPQADEKPE